MLLEGRERFEEESLHELREGSSSCDSGMTGITNSGLLILIGSINSHVVLQTLGSSF